MCTTLALWMVHQLGPALAHKRGRTLFASCIRGVFYMPHLCVPRRGTIYRAKHISNHISNHKCLAPFEHKRGARLYISDVIMHSSITGRGCQGDYNHQEIGDTKSKFLPRRCEAGEWLVVHGETRGGVWLVCRKVVQQWISPGVWLVCRKVVQQRISPGVWLVCTKVVQQGSSPGVFVGVGVRALPVGICDRHIGRCKHHRMCPLAGIQVMQYATCRGVPSACIRKSVATWILPLLFV